MATAREMLLDYSSLTGSHPASEHFKNIDTGGEKDVSGTIILQRGKWQLIAIYKKDAKVKEDFVDVLAEQEDVNASDIIEICSCYRGDYDRFMSYVPGVTSANGEGNFELIYADGDTDEISGFWVKMKEYTHTDEDLKFDWTS